MKKSVSQETGLESAPSSAPVLSAAVAGRNLTVEKGPADRSFLEVPTHSHPSVPYPESRVAAHLLQMAARRIHGNSE